MSEENVEIVRRMYDVYVVATQRGRGKGSGVDVETTYALLYEIDGDKITRLTGYPTTTEALEAAGLGE
jgi:ketosteroid isomerase-like protein